MGLKAGSAASGSMSRAAAYIAFSSSRLLTTAWRRYWCVNAREVAAAKSKASVAPTMLAISVNAHASARDVRLLATSELVAMLTWRTRTAAAGTHALAESVPGFLPVVLTDPTCVVAK